MNQVSDILSGISYPIPLPEILAPIVKREEPKLKMPSKQWCHLQLLADKELENIMQFCNSRELFALCKSSKRLRSISHFSRQTLCLNMVREEEVIESEEFFSFFKRFRNIQNLKLSNLRIEHSLIKPLQSFLTTEYPKKLKRLDLEPAQGTVDCMMDAMGLYQVTAHFFQTLCHPQIEYLRIFDSYFSFISPEIVNNVLTKLENLKRFDLETFNSFEFTVDLSNCKKLENLKLINCDLSYAFESMSICQNLTKLDLTVNSIGNNIRKVKEFLISEHGHDLRLLHLDLDSLDPILDDNFLDIAFKFLPNLKDVKITGANKFTDKGLITIAKLCPKLISLSLEFYHITDLGILEFSENAPQLRALFANSLRSISCDGIAHLTKNCKKLQILDLEDFDNFGVDFNSFNKNILFTLAANCKKLNLLHISFSPSIAITKEELRNIFRTFRALKYISINSSSLLDEGTDVGVVSKIYEEFFQNEFFSSTSLHDFLTDDFLSSNQESGQPQLESEESERKHQSFDRDTEKDLDLVCSFMDDFAATQA